MRIHLATAIASACLIACAAASAQSAAPLLVKIGVAGPKSGPIGHLGQDDEYGARMAIDDLNAKHVRIGGQPASFELLSGDDAANPKQAVAVAQQLIDAGVSGVVGHLNSGSTIPASKLYSDAGIVQISPSATNPKYTRQGYATAFRIIGDDTQLAASLAHVATVSFPGKRIAILDDRTAYGAGIADVFEREVKAAGGNIVSHTFATGGNTDLALAVAQIRRVSADVVFYGGMDTDAGPLFREISKDGANIAFMGGDGICTAELAKLAGPGLADGAVICAEAGGVGQEGQAKMETFRSRFLAKNGVEVQIYAPYTYDAVMVLAQAMTAAGSSDPQRYLPEVKKIRHSGVTGQIAFDEKGDIVNGAFTLYTFNRGQREQMMVYRPGD